EGEVRCEAFQPFGEFCSPFFFSRPSFSIRLAPSRIGSDVTLIFKPLNRFLRQRKVLRASSKSSRNQYPSTPCWKFGPRAIRGERNAAPFGISESATAPTIFLFWREGGTSR